jgi:hypothetical protein
MGLRPLFFSAAFFEAHARGLGWVNALNVSRALLRVYFPSGAL